MQIITRIEALHAAIKAFKATNDTRTVGFVPTMGALHAGHTSLISKGKQENGLMVASIFVNPTQFTEQSDLVNYPRTLDNDALLAEKAGCDLLFVPEVSEIYPDAAPKLLNIDFGLLEKYMEGAFRPGHFKGMATVVKRLFDIVQPDRAYFGEKDFQQLAVVRLMVQMLHIPIEIIGCPTIRENDGLAMSSRNIRLSPSEREASIIISKTLTEAQQNKKILSPEAIKVQAINHLKASSLIDVEYFELVDAESLTPVHSWSDSNNVRACVAVRLGNTRLIDNIAL